MAEEVLAYKSKTGYLYETQEEADRRDAEIDAYISDRERRNKLLTDAGLNTGDNVVIPIVFEIADVYTTFGVDYVRLYAPDVVDENYMDMQIGKFFRMHPRKVVVEDVGQ